jgi:hypothetical protein
MTDITGLKAKIHAKVYDLLRNADVNGDLSREIADKAAQAVGGTEGRDGIQALKSRVDHIDRHLELIEGAWRRLGEGLLKMREEDRQRQRPER